MDSYDPHTHSFVVKIWLEEAGSVGSSNQWRGYVTHVFTGERRYFQTLVDLSAFVEGYLCQMGVQPARHLCIPWWKKLKHWRSSQKS